MGFEFSIKFNENEFDGFLTNKLYFKVGDGIKRGINRTAKFTATEGVKQIKSIFRSKAINTDKAKKELGQDGWTPATGQNIANMKAVVKARSKRGVAMSKFAKPLAQQKQKGRPVSRRSSSRFEFKKGKTVRAQGSFIQRGKGGNLVAYRAKNGVQGKGRLKALYYKSYTAMLRDRDVQPQFEQAMGNRLQKNIDAALNNALRKL